MSGANEVAGRFEDELVRLYQAAGSPDQTKLIAQATKQSPPLILNAKSMSDWLGGLSIPRDDKVIRFLVAYLEPRALRQTGYRPRIKNWQMFAEAGRTAKRTGGAARSGSSSRGPVAVSRWPLVNERGPLEMGVHAAAFLPASTSPLALWFGERLCLRDVPVYVPRDHDRDLADSLDTLRRQGSGVVLIIGRSCTGKSRSAWEAVAAGFGNWFLVDMRDRGQRERITTTDLPLSDCILWLDNIDLSDDIAGTVAATTAALNAPGAGRRIAVATMWHQPELNDPNRPLRELAKLAGAPIHVAEAWTGRERDAAYARADSDEVLMAALSQPGFSPPQVLAGAKWALGLWRTPRHRETTALLNAAIDLASIGVGVPGGPPLSDMLLEQCTPAYLTRPTSDPDWYQRALHEVTTPIEDAVWTLTPPTTPDGSYRLFDPLLDYARFERWYDLLPAAVWAALAAADLGREHTLRLAVTARDRLLLREAETFERRAESMAPARSTVPPDPTPPRPPALATEPTERVALSKPSPPAAEESPREPLVISMRSPAREKADLLLEEDNLGELRALALRSNDPYVRRRLGRLYERRGDWRAQRELAIFSNRGGRDYIERLCREGNLTELLQVTACGAHHALRGLSGWQITGLSEEERQYILTVGLTPDGRVAEPRDCVG